VKRDEKLGRCSSEGICLVPTACEFRPAPRSTAKAPLRFTPAEWRRVLEDAAFLRDGDNSYAPRRLMGLPVEIVPDHRFG
jgi:hypothetical protein